MFINKHKSAEFSFNNSQKFYWYSNDLDYIYENIKEYNVNKETQILIVFDDTIADILTNIKF